MATIQNPSAQSHALIITHYHKIAFVITQSGCKRPLLQSLRTDMHSIKQILKANMSRSRRGYTNRKQTYNHYFPPTLYAFVFREGLTKVSQCFASLNTWQFIISKAGGEKGFRTWGLLDKTHLKLFSSVIILSSMSRPAGKESHELIYYV